MYIFVFKELIRYISLGQDPKLEGWSGISVSCKCFELEINFK
jgi:hypothetical protein